MDPASRTIEVLADVAPGGTALRPGTLVNVDFGTFADREGLFVPTTAVRSDGKASFVYVVAAGKAERRDVAVSSVTPGTMSVQTGLDAQAEVVQDRCIVCARCVRCSTAGWRRRAPCRARARRGGCWGW